jgi:methylated-DNA-[protein]-cysteine S-methyltransferase
MEGWTEEPDYPVFDALRSWLKKYFARQNPDIKMPLAPRGGDFRQSVWKLLLEIPYGQTTTYGILAARLPSGSRMSSQAVGGAVGHNPISIIIPCHRVLGADGSLTGYAGGLERKQALLELEGCATSLWTSPP